MTHFFSTHQSRTTVTEQTHQWTASTKYYLPVMVLMECKFIRATLVGLLNLSEQIVRRTLSYFFFWSYSHAHVIEGSFEQFYYQSLD